MALPVVHASVWSNHEGRPRHPLIGSLVGDWARASLLASLMTGQALTATELAQKPA
jgi:hypothetical protein